MKKQQARFGDSFNHIQSSRNGKRAMLKVSPHQNETTIIENWLKPPKLVQYSNSVLLQQNSRQLICQFYFPRKYAENDFFINGKKVLNKGEMFIGKRYFYTDRFYSLLKFYSKKNQLTAFYIDITLPGKIEKNNVYIIDLKLDFFILPDKISYYLLDENELEEAQQKKLFNAHEIEICLKTKDFIKEKIESGHFDQIFTSYKKSSYRNWIRYQHWLKTQPPDPIEES